MELFDPKSLIHAVGTIGLIVIIFAESGLLLGLIFPGDSLLFTAGLLSSSSKFGLNIATVAIGAILAAFLGAQVGYWLGRRFGPALFRRPDSRIFKQEYVERSREFFDRHGSKTIVLARFVPFVRTLVPMTAGIGEMQPQTFLAFNAIGAVLWAGGVTMLGYALGDRIGTDNVDKYLLPIIGVIIVLSLIPPLLEYRKHRREQRAAAAGTNDELETELP